MRALSQAAVGGSALVACLAFLLGGCGGGSGGAIAGTEARSGALPARGPDNSIQAWGHEADGAVRAQLTAVVQAYLDDRAARDWPAVCARLAKRQRAAQGILAGGKATCSEAMKSFASHARDATLRREAEIDVHNVRVGPHAGRLYAFVLYRRSDGAWATALVRESGRWRVVTVTPQRLS